MKLRLVALTLTLTLTLTIVAPVFAHAELVQSSPEANAALDRAPAQIEMTFSEALEPSFSEIQVLDSNGVRRDNADSRVDAADPTRLIVSLRSLPDGVYTVVWKVLSAVDGHVTEGAFPFAVGDVDVAALSSAAQASRQVNISIGEVIAKWLLYISATALAGGTLFILLVWKPAYQAVNPRKSDPNQSVWRSLATLSIAFVLVANIVGLLVQAGQAAGTEIALPWDSVVNTVLFTTRFGVLWIARAALALAVVGILPTAKTDRERWIAFGISLLILLTIALGSHAAADPDPFLPVAADWLHLAAASAWVGGLTHFVAGMWSARSLDSKLRTRLTARLIPRFSAVALLSVGVLVLTGLYASVLRIGSFEALNNSFYGRVLIVKLILLLPMLAIGAVNLLGVSPAMKLAAAEDLSGLALADRFRKIITSEITLGVTLFLSVGLLTSVPPARVATAPTGFNASAKADDLAIALNITPNRIGINNFTLTLTAGGQPVNETKDVLLRFTPASGKLPPSEVALTAKGNGQYTVRASNLNLAEQWQAQAVVRREGQFDTFANFNVDLRPATAGQSYPWNRIAGGLLLGAALAYIFAFSGLPGRRTQYIWLGILPGVALALASVAVFYRPAPAEQTGRINPVAANADSVAEGKGYYTTLCVPCHGETGKGDGPVGLTLNPRPADLSLHAVPGVHTDGKLFEWISNGYPGSVMPAFGQALTEEQLWHIVNYMRTLAP
ncbi:MAG: copper resistance protein CopC [Chloroflexi bacterium]|nr:copper resistance protein CopC [Chloroflexota bacterium]